MRYTLLGGLLTALFLFCHPISSSAQVLPQGLDETFATTSMNAVLATGVDAVVRLDQRHFEVDAPDAATTTVRRVVTVLNADGRDAGVLVVNYDDELRRLKKFSGTIRDANGNTVRRLKKNEQEDYSAISGFSLYDANRIRVGRMYHDSYPYSVEFEYEIEHNGLISWPTWYPLEHNLPVEFGQFDVSVPDEMQVRFRTTGLEIMHDSLLKGGRITHRWQVESLSVSGAEPYGPRWVNQTVAVHTAPTLFEIDGATGSMASWADFGAWYASLGTGRDILPPDALHDVHELTDGLTDDMEKARRIYDYLQKNTRYVSIQLGLGGWQPYDAYYVHTNGYGDCKALTNYLFALLQEVGIDSYPVLVRGGRGAADILPDFPSNQFTHVVLAVPQETDTLWLESTSQTLPFGRLGTFTEDRYGLLVKPDGGELVRTPRSRSSDNERIVRASIQVTASGRGSVEMTTRYTGNRLDHVRDAVANRPQAEQEEWIHSQVNAPNIDIVRADLSDVKPGVAEAEVSLALNLPRYAARTGSRLLLPIHMTDRWETVPPVVASRSHPVRYFGYAFVNTDSIRFELPDGYDVASMPDPVSLQTDFGEFSAEVVPLGDGVLEYRRQLRISQTTLPPEQYGAFRDFALQVSAADRSVVLLQAK